MQLTEKHLKRIGAMLQAVGNATAKMIEEDNEPPHPANVVMAMTTEIGKSADAVLNADIARAAESSMMIATLAIYHAFYISGVPKFQERVNQRLAEVEIADLIRKTVNQSTKSS